MTCDRFRERCHILVDERDADRIDEEMLAHMETCQSCADFRRDLIAADRILRQVPAPPLPALLAESLSDIGKSRHIPSVGWRPDLERAARYLIPGLLLWGGQWVFPESARPYLLASMTFLGIFTYVTSVLRSRVLGTPEI